MTNTLHRYGKAESFVDDYIVFSLPAKSKAAGQTGDALAAQKRFMQIAAEFRPCSLGDALHGGSLRPTKSKSIFGHWGKRNKPNFKKVLEGMSKAGTMAAVFDNRIAAEDLMKAVREADLGLSVNISTSIDGAEQCCHAAGIPRHSVGYSLGFEGKTEHLPNEDVLKLSTMCGHGMVASSLAKKMIDWVKEGRRTPEQAATYMARFCSCGVYNPARAKRILEDARHKTE